MQVSRILGNNPNPQIWPWSKICKFNVKRTWCGFESSSIGLFMEWFSLKDITAILIVFMCLPDLDKLRYIPKHSVWKMSHFNFGILVFFTNFCSIKNYMPGNTQTETFSVIFKHHEFLKNSFYRTINRKIVLNCRPHLILECKVVEWAVQSMMLMDHLRLKDLSSKTPSLFNTIHYCKKYGTKPEDSVAPGMWSYKNLQNHPCIQPYGSLK